MSFDFDHLRYLLGELPYQFPNRRLWIVGATSLLQPVWRLRRLSTAGPGIAAIADVLEHFINFFSCDEVLRLWPPAILEAARNVYKNAGKTIPTPLSHSSVAASKKRAVPGQDRPGPVGDQGDNETEPALDYRQKKKLKTTSVPTWINLPEPSSATGRPRNRLARKISVLCYDLGDTRSAKQLCCEPSALLSRQAPSAVVEQLYNSEQGSSTALVVPSTSSTVPSSSSSGPSPLFELASSSGRQQLKAVVDFDIPELKPMIHHLNSQYTPVSSSMLADNQIPAEASQVLEQPLSIL
ncbi:hypothetical protein RhiJN_18609 [Ceratobasidium sp. AG-Ba]|nr:hypothetical protein RhiJN_18609 [Ceratobasidium sp. AG-Ba]